MCPPPLQVRVDPRRPHGSGAPSEWVWGVGSRVQVFGVEGVGSRVQVWGLGFRGLGSRVQVFGV